MAQALSKLLLLTAGKCWVARTRKYLIALNGNCTISTGIPNLDVWCKKWSNWTYGVGQKNPTPTPSVVRNLTPLKNLRLWLRNSGIVFFLGPSLFEWMQHSQSYWGCCLLIAAPASDGPVVSSLSLLVVKSSVTLGRSIFFGLFRRCDWTGSRTVGLRSTCENTV